MMTLTLTKSSLLKYLTMAVFIFMISQFLFIPVSGADSHNGLGEDAAFLDYMEHIAEDIEEIHGDMHTVAYALKLMAVSNMAMAGLMFVAVVLLFMFYRKNS